MSNPIPLDELLSEGFSIDFKVAHLLSGNKNKKTTSLIYELATTEDAKETAPFTLYDTQPKHYKVTPNGAIRYDLRQLYLGLSDPTEAEFVQKFMYDKATWAKMVNLKVFQPHIKAWREALEFRLKGQMYNILAADAQDPLSKTATSSAKYLINQFDKIADLSNTDRNNSRGRPSKKLTKADLLVLEDHKRILGESK